MHASGRRSRGEGGLAGVAGGVGTAGKKDKDSNNNDDVSKELSGAWFFLSSSCEKTEESSTLPLLSPGNVWMDPAEL